MVEERSQTGSEFTPLQHGLRIPVPRNHEPRAKGSLVRYADHFASRHAPENSVEFAVAVAGEEFRRVIDDPDTFHSFADSRDRLASDLADWVAESTFGWGQERD